MKSCADMRESASRSRVSMLSVHLTCAVAGDAASTARRKRTKRDIERVPSPLRTPRPRCRLARRLGDRKKVTLTEIGIASPLEFLIVAPQGVLLGQIADDRLVGRRIDHRHD